MSQATEMELRETIEKYLAAHPIQHETIYIKIVDNTVRISETIEDVETLQPYPERKVT